MTPHRTIDRWIRENPYRVDLILGLGMWLLFGLGSAFLMGYGGNGFTLVVVASAQTLPLIWRRKHPGLAAAIIVAAHLIQLVTYTDFLPSQISVPIVVYTLAAYAKRWQSIAGMISGFVGAFLMSSKLLLLGGSWSLEGWLISFMGLALTVMVSWTFGDLARTRRIATQTLEDRARRLEIERQQERDLAAADERSHIAREMHDIVAHSLSVIITQADGARYASEHDPEIARETLATISNTGRGSLREMRRLLGVLRNDEEASTRPLPTLTDVEDLLESTRKTGLDIEYNASGQPRRELPAGAELTAYRSVQEALTNVVKHAGPSAKAVVSLSWDNRGLKIVIADNGRGAGALGTADSGQGLRGMHERVSLYDGQVEATPQQSGGFRVAVFIPYTED
ncbi:two-component sensor histidine kinase [Arthrobacter sp. MYb227]|uniref:sensor histidine kinase n=1 Tax=Arthrobacter sp. MYb227 TaxID=1848601 RepID=UPI000CFA8E31|nr:sensor histidine kinase [Arthrobacter sp. MYb227]PQZ92232.1 two-component sensor histidine kinase [Arthrobacter sp. MYb227]